MRGLALKMKTRTRTLVDLLCAHVTGFAARVVASIRELRHRGLLDAEGSWILVVFIPGARYLFDQHS